MSHSTGGWSCSPKLNVGGFGKQHIGSQGTVTKKNKFQSAGNKISKIQSTLNELTKGMSNGEQITKIQNTGYLKPKSKEIQITKSQHTETQITANQRTKVRNTDNQITESKAVEQKISFNDISENHTAENKKTMKQSIENQTFENKRTIIQNTGHELITNMSTEIERTKAQSTEQLITEKQRTDTNDTNIQLTGSQGSEKHNTTTLTTEKQICEKQSSENLCKRNQTNESQSTESSHTTENRINKNNRDENKSSENRNTENQIGVNQSSKMQSIENQTNGIEDTVIQITQKKRIENPTTETQSQENQTTEIQSTEKQSTENQTGENQSIETQTTEIQSTDNQINETKRRENKTTKTGTTENQSKETETTENHSNENQSTENQTTENQTTENPTTENQTTENPTTENQTTENPTTENQTIENPTTENQTTENPTTENQTTVDQTSENENSDQNQTAADQCNENQNTKEEKSENQCEQCKDDGVNTDAKGFCTECGDYLCNNCITLHSRLRGLKRHTILTDEDMPRQKPQNTGTDKCPQHPDEVIKVFCISENMIGCIRCFTEGHSFCDTGLIVDHCNDIETSEEMKNIQTAAEQRKKRVELYREVIHEYHLINNTCFDECLKDFRSFRIDIEEMQTLLWKVVSAEAERLKDENKKKLDTISDTVTSLDQEIESLFTEIELHQKAQKRDRVFISVKNNHNEIQSKGEELHKLNEEIHVPSFRFLDDPIIKRSINKMISTAAIKVFTGDISCTDKINVKTPDDIFHCVVVGMVEVSRSEFMVADCTNQCIKTVNVDKNEITRRRPLSSPPQDITIVSGSRVAVTLPGQQKIQLFSLNESLDPCGIITVDGQCLSIVAAGDHMIVSFSKPVKIEMMDQKGNILKSIVSSTSEETPLFGIPAYMSIKNDHSVIYVSDWERNTVTSVDMDGTVLWKYEDVDLCEPCGVITGSNGCVYVCSCKTDRIHVLSPTGVKLRMVPLAQFEMEFPQALCNIRGQDSLYVSSTSSKPDQRNYMRRLYLH